MRSLVLGLLLPCLTPLVMAQSVWKDADGETVVFFYATPCEVPPIARLMTPYGEARKAIVVFDGRRINACFLRTQEGDYLLLDEEGDAARVPSKQVQEVGA